MLIETIHYSLNW